MNVRSAKPLVTTTGWAIGAYLVAFGLQLGARGSVEVSVRALVVCLAGALYTNLFEHLWHRYAMHGRRPDARHARHHRIFYGQGFQTFDPAALGEVVLAWSSFRFCWGSLSGVHRAVRGWARTAFFLGVVLHFVTYEVTHWFTHVANMASIES